MTHELKTPISTIALSAEVISDPAIAQEPDRLANYARIIRSENERLRTQVERVLQLARMDREHMELERQPVDLQELVAEVVDAFALPAEERRVTLNTRMDTDRAVVSGDRVHLTNALFNLVDNALKYGPDGNTITIVIGRADQRLWVAVSDRGIGIRKEDLPHIFERFFRVSTGNVHDVKGFGLGLHYVPVRTAAMYRWKVYPARAAPSP
jgi:two-component system phosphate regulon sensor histidine kinase PhoR